MKRRPLINLLLVLSLLGNIGIVVLLLRQRSPQIATMAPAGPRTTPKVMIDSQNFDFSDTKLSDESWKLPAPATKAEDPTEAPTPPDFK